VSSTTRPRTAADPASAEFVRLTDPFRRELLAYCYRMTASVHEAEDLVQETYLLAWRGYGEFEGRSSLRTWLYRIATNVCLKALERAARRPLPSGLAGPGDPDAAPDPRQPEMPWLQPIPDAMFGSVPADPAATVASRHSMRLALVAVLQQVPPRQRAVFLLRDVLAWRAAEVAELFGATTASVNSALQRARTQLAQADLAEDEVVEPTDPDQRALVDEFAAAFQNADITTLMRLLTQDAVLEMPPIPTWFAGREHIGRFLTGRLRTPGAMRMIPTSANGQPAFAVYTHNDEGDRHAHAIVLLTLATAGIARITMFHDPDLFSVFGLPATTPPPTRGSSPPRP